MGTLFVTGTGTGVGKTVASAWLCLHLRASYWKPVQAGLDPPTDTDLVRQLAGLSPGQIHPERYRLQWPASPHAAAAQEGIRIDLADLQLPAHPGTLIVEGAGGLLVPLNDHDLYGDWVGQQRIPTVLVVHTVLGCINHALLTLEALRHRHIPCAGIIFNDGGRPESESMILKKADAPLLGRIPMLPELTQEALLAVPMLAAPLI